MKELGDMSMDSMSFDVPSMEEFKKTPCPNLKLSLKIIVFITKDLTLNWIHPLFLKMKTAAKKEDNANWWEAMCGSFADKYWKATITERLMHKKL